MTLEVNLNSYNGKGTVALDHLQHLDQCCYMQSLHGISMCYILKDLSNKYISVHRGSYVSYSSYCWLVGYIGIESYPVNLFTACVTMILSDRTLAVLVLWVEHYGGST